MFISDAEARTRINSSKNVLTKISSDGDSPVGIPHTQDPPSIFPDPPSELPLSEPTDADIFRAATFEGNQAETLLLRKMMGMAPQGRYKGVPNMPLEVRAATAVCADLVNTRTAAQVFETSLHHADELKHGYTNQAARYGEDEPNSKLEKMIAEQKRQVRDLAFEKLTKTLGLISDDKLEAVTDVTKLARISRDLSAVVDKTLPKEQAILGGVHFHVWKPELREESTYEVVTVGAPPA